MVVTVKLTTLSRIRQKNPCVVVIALLWLLQLQLDWYFSIETYETKNQCCDNCLSRKKKNNSRRQREARVNTRMTKLSLYLISYEWLRGKQNQCKSRYLRKKWKLLDFINGASSSLPEAHPYQV